MSSTTGDLGSGTGKTEAIVKSSQNSALAFETLASIVGKFGLSGDMACRITLSRLLSHSASLLEQ